MTKNLYPASEIAEMGIAGLPTSRQNIIIKAEREGWYFEERSGRGGTHKVYEIPAHYLSTQEFSGIKEAPAVAKLFTATEIAAKAIPGLPVTKKGIIGRAEAEGWRFEERKGLGGTHKVYEIPARYLSTQEFSGIKEAPAVAYSPSLPAKVAPVAFAREKETRERMLIIMEGLDTFLAENKVSMPPDRKVFLVDVLYRYFELEGVFSKESLAEVIKKLA